MGKVIPVVKIVDKNKRGFKTINASDFDSKTMKKYVKKKTATKKLIKEEL